MKTKKEFLSDYSSNPELARKTLNVGGVDWSDLKENITDYMDASSGSVTGLIYYEDTVKFAKKNHLLILQALQGFEDEIGEPLNKPNPTEETQYFNWLAWFAWENMTFELDNYLNN